MRAGVLCTTVSIFNFLSLIPTGAHASAGYYPVEIGEVLKAEVCLPNKIKPPISLQLNDGDHKPITVKALNAFPKLITACGNQKRLVVINWKVDRSGTYALSFYHPKSKVSYAGWPDGVEIKSN